MTVTDLRRFTIGGSDAAAACGIDPYRSAIHLWLEKTRPEQLWPPDGVRPVTDAMHFGTLLEPLVRGEVESRGYEVMPAPQDGFVDPDFSWMVGHPDGFVSLEGERAVLEVKTVGQWAHRAHDGVPVHYQAQCQHYMALTETNACLFACLVGGQRLELHTIERDDAAIATLRLLELDFYEHLRRDRMPAPDSSQSARDALLALFPGAEPSKLVRLDREHWRLVRELRARKEQAERIGEQVRELENRLKAFMGDAELAISPHDTDALRWTNVQSRRVDTKALREAKPELADEFTTVTTTRRFSLL